MIYIVEDDTDICELEQYALRNNGFETTGFGDGKSFFAACEKKLPELVILDIMLPDQNGLDICRQLRQGADNHDIHVVMVTAQELELAHKEYELLRFFIENPGKELTREELMNRVWNTDFSGESRTLDIHIRTLRQKLGCAGNYIHTVRKVGYQLTLESGTDA